MDSGSSRVIKGGALAFAVFLICIIIAGICGVGIGVARMFKIWDVIDASQSAGDLAVIEGAEWTKWTADEVRQNLKELKIDVRTAAVRIVDADEFRVETNNKHMMQEYRDGRLSLIEQSFDFWADDWESELVIYWPSGMKLEEAYLSTGASQVRIDKLEAETVSLGLGAGRAEIGKLVATRVTNIDGGAGVLEIADGELHNLDLDMGVGRVAISAQMTGKNKIDAGLGRLEVNLKGNTEDYSVKINKGLGAVRINGQNIGDGEVYGNGEAMVEIDGGVGSIEVEIGL